MKKDKETGIAFDETIFGRYLTGNTTPSEDRELREWIEASEENRRSFAGIRALWQRSPLEAAGPDNVRFTRSLNELNRRLNQFDALAVRRRPLLRNIHRIAVSAAAAAVLFAASLALYHTVLAPEVFTLHNPGETAMRVELPDGTGVWLGTETTLTFDDAFRRKKRDVKLYGEAYFDVTHDASCPFIVHTSSFNISVLGTAFNVKAYSGAQTAETTLVEGSISLQNLDNQNLILLHPGQQAVYDIVGDALTIKEVAVGNLLLIRYGVITLPDATLAEIVSSIEETFGVRLHTDGPLSDRGIYNFSMQKNAPIEDALELLQFVSGYRFDVVKTE